MLDIDKVKDVYLECRETDLRKSMNGFSRLCRLIDILQIKC